MTLRNIDKYNNYRVHVHSFAQNQQYLSNIELVTTSKGYYN